MVFAILLSLGWRSASRFLKNNLYMEIINTILIVIGSLGIITGIIGLFLMYFISKYQKLGKGILIFGLGAIILVFVASLIFNIISG